MTLGDAQGADFSSAAVAKTDTPGHLSTASGSSQSHVVVLCFRYNSAQTHTQGMTIYTLKSETLYMACSLELGLISYGDCRDEAVNNLAEDVRTFEQMGGQHAT